MKERRKRAPAWIRQWISMTVKTDQLAPAIRVLEGGYGKSFEDILVHTGKTGFYFIRPLTRFEADLKKGTVPENRFLFNGWERPNRLYYWIILIFESISFLILHSGQVFNSLPFVELSFLQTRPQLPQAADFGLLELSALRFESSGFLLSWSSSLSFNLPTPMKCRVFSLREFRAEGSR